MFINYVEYIFGAIRTITSVMLTLAQKNLCKNKFLLVLDALPSEGRGWGAAYLNFSKINKWLISYLDKTRFGSLYLSILASL